jgi:hypothetical protein
MFETTSIKVHNWCGMDENGEVKEDQEDKMDGKFGAPWVRRDRSMTELVRSRWRISFLSNPTDILYDSQLSGLDLFYRSMVSYFLTAPTLVK